MQGDQGFGLRYKDGVTWIVFADLEYVEVINKTVFFHMADGIIYEAVAALADFEGELLARPEFVKTHRSYIVNLSYVQAVGGHSAVTKSGRVVLVSRQRRNQVQDAYLQYLHQAEPAAASFCARALTDAQKEARPGGLWQILFVDDDSVDRAFWSEILKSHGCIVHQAGNGREALKLAGREHFDCVLLDVRIPGEDGFSICEKLRSHTGAPVIFLSCLTEAEKQMQGFAAGGIDYITKDTPAELFWAKVKTRVELSASGSALLRFGPLLLDLRERKAKMNGKELSLTLPEFDILWRISEHAGRILTPEEIFGMVWGAPSSKGGQLAQMHMSRLRRKLDTAQEGHCFIETVWGKGYRFVPPDR